MLGKKKKSNPVSFKRKTLGFLFNKLKIEIMVLRGSTVETRRRLMIYSPYTNSNLDLTDEDMVIIRERGQEPEYLTIEDMIERFEEMPSVRAYGIIRVEILVRETNERERIVRTGWDDLRDERSRLRRIEVDRQIERLESSLT